MCEAHAATKVRKKKTCELNSWENANMPEAKSPERKLIKVSLSLCCKTWKRMFFKRTVYFLKCTNDIPFYFNGYSFGLRFIILFPDNVPLLTPIRQLCDVTYAVT